MPALSKKALSLFLRNHCERQFIFSLYQTVAERAAHNLPALQVGRAGLGLVAQAGYDWQDEKISEIKDIFGSSDVHISPTIKNRRPAKIDLLTVLPQAKEYQFIVESSYDPDTSIFRSALGITGIVDSFGTKVDIKSLVPDIIQTLPPSFLGTNSRSTRHRNPYTLGVLPDGELFPLDSSDRRLRLRVIDIKLASEPGPHYFAEVVYYSMTLVGWLVANQLADKFVVLAAPAVWPGSHDASNLAKAFAQWNKRAYQPTSLEKTLALEEDLELAEFDVYAPRLRRFLREDFPLMLQKPLASLTWHVDAHCKGCEFLIDPNRIDTNRCLRMAEAQKHLSRVVGLSRGASEYLRQKNVGDLSLLSTTNLDSPQFADHQTLRAKRTTFPHRAKSLETNETSIIPNSGGDALMPKWPDLHVYAFLDYDLSSAITASIALRAFWKEPLPYPTSLIAEQKNWTPKKGDSFVFLIDKRTIEREREEFLKFLHMLREIFDEVTRFDAQGVQGGRRDKRTEHSTYQIYLWDEAQRKHLVRLVGRHLPYILSDPKLCDLAWLFPPPELLQRAEDATRQSPITLVLSVIDNTVAVPIAHHHQLLEVAKNFKPAAIKAPSVHPLYQELMSDLIPPERIHEWWNRKGNPWQETQNRIEETAQAKVLALGMIVRQLETELASVLNRHSAPPVNRKKQPQKKIAPQSRLWLEFARLNSALEHLEVHTIRSMPPQEREARLKSARLLRRLSEREEQQALVFLNKTIATPLSSSPGLYVYRMRPGSKEVNLKPGDFQYALAPESRFGFLDEHPFLVTRGTRLEGQWLGNSLEDSKLTGVSILAIDRENGYIALRKNHRAQIEELEHGGQISFAGNVVLDPIYEDFLTKKIGLTLEGIGYPPNATTDTRTLQALGLPANTPLGKSRVTPAAEILWEAKKLHLQQTQRTIQTIRVGLESNSTSPLYLDSSQWDAFDQSLSRRLSLIWGPPGTGKSKTLRAIILGAVYDALLDNQPLRLLVTANTYTAVENVLFEVAKDLQATFPSKSYELYRIQSKWQEEPDLSKVPDLRNLVLNRAHPSDDILDLVEKLEHPSRIVIIGCLPQQLHNLSVTGKAKPKAEYTIRSWFDLILLDEASQIDVATSTLVFTKIDKDGSLVLAGDDLQLPPIQEADPPQDLEFFVGSAYNYFRHHHDILPASLNVNYRSNATIVEFTKLAGYSQSLQSKSPNLKLDLVLPLPTVQPPNWPPTLYWSPAWERFLDPNDSVACFIYDDQLSSQINEFEADAVSSLIWLLNERVSNQLLNELDRNGNSAPKSASAYSMNDFWGKAVGVVTPHRAQMAKIINRLQLLLPNHPRDLIRGAIDTVERFQGQQRDVILASFGLGDLDIIRSEDEFLYSLNRFNVLASRARAKLIVFVTRSLLDHLSDDIDVLYESRLLKQFAESYCIKPESVTVGYIKGMKPEERKGFLRRR